MDFILTELKELRGAFARTLVVFLTLTMFCLLTPAAQNGIEKLQHDLVPAGVSLAALTPLDPFFAQTTVAASLALLAAGPYLLWELWLYVAPGLYPGERRALRALLLAGSALFGAGAWFAYRYIIPATFAGLYLFAPRGVESFYSLRDFVSLVAGMAVGVGLLFELPIVMMVLTRIGLVPPQFWSRYVRHAILLALIASAIITPDGSGISMLLLSLPICLLYGVGWVGSGVMARRRSAAGELLVSQ